MISSFEQVSKIVSEHLNLNPDKIKPESSFMDDLGADSLDMVELLMVLEENFAIEIPDADAEKLQKLSDVIKYIEHKAKI